MPPDLLQFTAPIELTAAADQSKPVKISIRAYTGGAMQIAGFGSVVVDLAGLDISRPVPLLAEHQSDLAGLLGTGQASTNGRELNVNGVLSRANDLTEKIVAMAADGVSFSASVGVQPLKRENIREGQTVSVNGRTLTAGNQGLTIIRSGRLREVSLLPIGADPNTQVSIAATAAQSKETKIMPETIIIEPKTDSKKILARWKATKFNQQIVADQTENYLHAALAGEISFTDFEHQMVLAENRDLRLTANYADLPKAPAIHASTRDTQPQVIEASFCKTLGLREIEKHYKPEVLEAADRSGCPGVQELILRAAMANGYDAGRLRIDAGNIREVLRAAFQPGIQASGVSTIDVSSILSNTANKVLLDGFTSVEQTWRLISKIRPVKDFKDSVSHRLTDSLEYEELPPTGEIHHGTLGEETYTNRARTHAKMLALTREAIINDDLGAFDTIRQRLGRGAALKLNKVFWTAFLDDAAFFTEARGNLLTGVLTDDPDSLNEAVAAFADLTDGDGNPLGILPAILLAPPILSPTAKRLYASTEIRNTTDSTQYVTANIHQGMYKPAVSAYLASAAITGHSSTAWWLLADPRVLPAMEVCFLDGLENPTIESADADFNTLGIQFRGYHDFGCVKAEWRAGVKSTGAGE